MLTKVKLLVNFFDLSFQGLDAPCAAGAGDRRGWRPKVCPKKVSQAVAFHHEKTDEYIYWLYKQMLGQRNCLAASSE